MEKVNIEKEIKIVDVESLEGDFKLETLDFINYKPEPRGCRGLQEDGCRSRHHRRVLPSWRHQEAGHRL
jgi:hypothetical protein